MKDKLKILHLEDLVTDARLVERELLKGNIVFEKLVVDNKEDFENALNKFYPDIILSDHKLVSFNSIEALEIVRNSVIDVPFILITATVSEEFAVSVLQQGADDYILKDNMERLPSSIRHAIDKYEAREAITRARLELEEAHERLLIHLENSPLGYIEWNVGDRITAWSKRTEEIFGWTMEEFNEGRKGGFKHVYSEDQPWVAEMVDELLNGSIKRNNVQCRYHTREGKVIWCEWFNSVLKSKEGKVVTIMSLVQDITERKTAEQALVNNELRFREFFETAPEALLVIDASSGLFVDYNDNALKLFLYTGSELRSRTPAHISPLFQPDGSRSDEKVKKYIVLTLQGEKPIFEWVHCDSNGKDIFCEVRLNLLTGTGQTLIRASILDISERVQLQQKLAEAKRKKQVEITQAIITGQERERTALGQELHDNINQILATSKLYLDFSISSAENRKDALGNSRGLLIQAMEEIRKLSKSLLPPSLGEIGLEAAIDELVESIEQVNKLNFIKEWKVRDETMMSEKLKLMIFRIVQEQLNNIIKYAGAKTVVIGLRHHQAGLILSIKDDGVGFDTTAKRQGIGLKNIVSRASLFNGKLSINSKPGAGCELVVRLGLKSSID